MFPDRIDRVVLDGVVNPHEYYAGRLVTLVFVASFADVVRSDVQSIHDTDSVLSEFFKGCVAAPPGICPLAYPGATATDLEQAFIDLLDDIKYNPIATSPAETGSTVNYGAIKTFVAGQLYNPVTWAETSAALYGLLHRNTTLFTTLNSEISSAAGNLGEVNAGIRCSDNDIRAQNRSEVMPVVEAMYNSSFSVGDIQAGLPLGCASWRFRAKERYTRGFTNITTKSPLLFIGNTFDPVTPLVSAQNASAGFEGSVVLQHDGHGVSSDGRSFRY